MKRSIFLLLALLLLALFGFRVIRANVKKDLDQPVALPSISPTPTSVQLKGAPSSSVTTSLFVPYWGLDDEVDQERYHEFLYFGITPTQNGINRGEAGYASLDEFVKSVPEKSDAKLVLRMLDANITFPLLKDPVKQERVIRDTVILAKRNGFEGIVLDLEITAVPFDSLVAQINRFTQSFYTETKKNDLEFTLMFYGDTFYRFRPFDVKTLSKNADSFLIMTYDFHKARGNPGPNFPLNGKEIYGYDMTRMVDDFLRYLPPERTGVVFGLYGYDWEVDDKGSAISQGEAKSYQKIKKEFLGECAYKNCEVKRKNDSKETEVRYIDNEGKKHVVWFEDMESAKAKEKYLRKRGIGIFSYWAHSYF